MINITSKPVLPPNVETGGDDVVQIPQPKPVASPIASIIMPTVTSDDEAAVARMFVEMQK